MSGEEAAVHVLPLCSLASLNWLPLVGLRKQGHVFRLFEVSDERKSLVLPQLLVFGGKRNTCTSLRDKCHIAW